MDSTTHATAGLDDALHTHHIFPVFISETLR